jgi:hypothetical protein
MAQQEIGLTQPKRLGLRVAAGLTAALAVAGCSGGEQGGPRTPTLSFPEVEVGPPPGPCVPAHYDRPGPAGTTPRNALLDWYDKFGADMDAPSSPWLMRPTPTGKRIVSPDWGTLIVESSIGGMGGYSVTDLSCD